MYSREVFPRRFWQVLPAFPEASQYQDAFVLFLPCLHLVDGGFGSVSLVCIGYHNQAAAVLAVHTLEIALRLVWVLLYETCGGLGYVIAESECLGQCYSLGMS